MIHYGATRPEGWRPPVKVVTDSEILRENHRFIRTEDDDGVLTWEKKLAKKYYGNTEFIIFNANLSFSIQNSPFQCKIGAFC